MYNLRSPGYTFVKPFETLSQQKYSKSFQIVTAFLLIFNSICAQDDRPTYSLTYSLSRSAINTNTGGNFEDGLSSSFFGHYEFGKMKSRRYSIGLGFVESHIIFRDYSGMQSYRDEERHYHIKYLVLPAGMKFFIGSFYVHPEVGISYNYGIKTQSHLVDYEMKITSKKYVEKWNSRRFAPLLFNALTVGYEFQMSSYKLLTAVKSHIAFNPRFSNTYGIGLMVGLKF